MRVLILAPDPLARGGLAALLTGHPTLEIVGQAAPDQDLAATVQTYRPDVVLWDLGWNPLASLTSLAEFSNQLPPILALVADGEAAAQVWMADVRGLLLRATSGETLAVALA